MTHRTLQQKSLACDDCGVIFDDRPRGVGFILDKADAKGWFTHSIKGPHICDSCVLGRTGSTDISFVEWREVKAVLQDFAHPGLFGDEELIARVQTPGTKAVFVGPTATQAYENLSARANHRECR